MAETPPELQGEVEKLEQKHAEDPGGRYFVPLANAYRRLGRQPEAESLLREGLRHHPGYLSAHVVLGRCLADQGEAGPASEEFRYVLSVDPQNLVALRSLGELALSGGRAEEAGRWFRELLAVDPMNEEARRALDCLEASSVHPDAPLPLDEEGEAEEPAPEDAEEEVELVTETIAELYARQGLYGRSAEVYGELIRRRGGDPAMERRRAEVLRLAGREERAGNEPAAPAVPAADARPEERTIAEFLVELASWRPGEAPVEHGSDPLAARGEDDDLESFQAWLRSLKR